MKKRHVAVKNIVKVGLYGLDLTVGYGVGLIVGGAIKQYLPSDIGKFKLAAARIGGVALVSMISHATSVHIKKSILDLLTASDAEEGLKSDPKLTEEELAKIADYLRGDIQNVRTASNGKSTDEESTTLFDLDDSEDED